MSRFISLSLVLLTLSAASSAAVLYSQPNDRASQPSFFSDAIPGQFFSQRMADNFFLLGDSQEITGVRWWGGSQFFAFPDLTNMASFTILITPEGPGGGPDLNNILVNQTVLTANTNPVATGQTIFGGGTQYEQFVALDAPVTVPFGIYWISIGATLNNAFGDGWVWSGSTVGDLVNATDYFNGSGFQVFNPTFNDLAFEIVGVPEPTAAIGLLALGALAIRRR